MLTKMKIALVLCGTLLCGVAAAQPATGGAVDRKAEIKAQRQAHKQEKLAKFDTNKNGTLDQTERSVMHDTKVLTRFKKIDTDGNGVLSLTEFKAAKQMKGKGRGQPRRQLGGRRGYRGARDLIQAQK